MNKEKIKLPYLVQRINFRDIPLENKKGIDKYFKFDYMGSSEYEWGALPEALKKAREVPANKWKIKKIEGKNKIVWYVGTEESLTCAEAFFADQIGAAACLLKERTGIASSLGLDKSAYSGYDGWWAIDAKPPWALFVKEECAKKWLDGLLGKY